ncbi:mechanosensitive ion channel [Flammeovirgaceae bacterium SG7u.111]|nr:mechanosensitive ion channel [Flammeovirgaceae bacterium SG7u.132]WPO36048.1 mechanosensitive ion channel [Flammeovirgaceae bacterium SG7u.111]
MLEELIQSFSDFKDSVIHGLPAFVIGLVFLATFTSIGSLLRKYSRKRLFKRLNDRLLVNFIGRFIFLAMLTIGIVLFLNQVGLGKAAGGLLAGAGVSAIIIGFAFKDIGENLLAGFFLAFSRPFGIGDVIEIESIKGKVRALSFRNTHIRTFDGKDIYVPNAMLIKHPLINYTRDGLLRYDFVVGIDYANDVTKAVDLVTRTLESEQKIENEGNLKPFILLEELGTNTINLRIFYWVNSYKSMDHIAELRTKVVNRVVSSLINNGFNLPANIVEVKPYSKPKPLPL